MTPAPVTDEDDELPPYLGERLVRSLRRHSEPLFNHNPIAAYEQEASDDRN